MQASSLDIGPDCILVSRRVLLHLIDRRFRANDHFALLVVKLKKLLYA